MLADRFWKRLLTSVVLVFVAGETVVAQLPTPLPVAKDPKVAADYTAAPPKVIWVVGNPAWTGLGWQAVAPATGVTLVQHEVQRWHRDFPDCCRASIVIPHTWPNWYGPGWTDYHLPLAGVYVYRLTTSYSDGTRGTVQFEHTRPEPVNPTSLTARQVDPTSVQLTWPSVGGATFYLVWGPGTASTGMIVLEGTTNMPGVTWQTIAGVMHYSVTLTGIPYGTQNWSVGSFYEPAVCGNHPNPCPRVSTAGSAFTQASLVVVSKFVGLPQPTRPPDE